MRVQLRSEIKALQNRLRFTAIHVTHDREEAMTMADRIVVMDAGRIAQVGAPKEVYDRPASPFVASFMGAENTISLDVRPSASGVEVRTADGHAGHWTKAAPLGPVTAYFRDDVARLDRPDARVEGAIVLPGTIAQRTYPGGHYRYAVAIGDRHFTVTDDRYLDLERRSACACRSSPCTSSQAPIRQEETMLRLVVAAGLAAALALPGRRRRRRRRSTSPRPATRTWSTTSRIISARCSRRRIRA